MIKSIIFVFLLTDTNSFNLHKFCVDNFVFSSIPIERKIGAATKINVACKAELEKEKVSFNLV